MQNITNEPFLKHLNVQKTPHVIVTAEDEEFDDIFVQDLRDEGFNVVYLAQEDQKPNAFAQKIHAAANNITGVNEHYAIIAFGDAASAVLETHMQASPKLCAIIAYYPSTIPDPARTRYPMNVSVLLHLAGSDIGIRRTQEILGIQGKRKTLRRNLAKGVGLGGELKLNCPTYSYKEVGHGFAENDLEEFDAIAAGVAWTRTLKALREAFAIRFDVEGVRDRHIENLKQSPEKALKANHTNSSVICAPTAVGGTDANSLHTFYTEHFHPNLTELNARLISRTIGVDRVVDELLLSFKHDKEIPWLLPNVPPTKKRANIMLVSIVSIKARKVFQERLYWDQASLLLQLGLLDANSVGKVGKDLGVERLPVVGAEGTRAVMGELKGINDLLEG